MTDTTDNPHFEVLVRRLPSTTGMASFRATVRLIERELCGGVRSFKALTSIYKKFSDRSRGRLVAMLS